MRRATPQKSQSFAREATGLVRAASSWEATIWNISNIMGSKFPWTVARLGLFPAGLIIGWPPYLLAFLLFGLASYILSILYVQITCAMPRSGADYVIPSRLMGPFWGWVQSWMTTCALVPVWGYLIWVTIRNTKQFIDIMRIAGLTSTESSWILTGAPALAIGFCLVLAAMAICFLPSKRYYRIIGVLGALGILSLVITMTGTALVSQPLLDANMKALFGQSTNELVQKAVSNGFDPNGGFDSLTAAGLGGLALYGISGFQYSATISGELKGKIRSALTTSILGSLTLFLVLFLPLIWILLSRFGYNFVVAWSFLFWNKSSSAPLALPPINALLLTVAVPNLALVWAIAGFAAILGAWSLIPANMLYINRLTLSWSMDRMLPASVSEVAPKFGQPLKLLALEGVLGLVFFTFTFLNLNPVAYLWWGTILLLPSFVFPAISALLLPRRRPDLMHAVPWRRWLAPLAALWLIIIIPFYAFAGVIGSIPLPTPGSSFWGYAMTTGLIATGLTVVAGCVIYLVVRSYNKRRGIEVDLIFASIPPE